MPSPFLAPSLARLRTAIDMRWPGRDHSSDGWIGDPAHQARVSDHNPDPVSGVVRALDIDKDGVHMPSVLAAAFRHPAVRYVIHNRRIHHVDNNMASRPYTGSNPHTGHAHVSIEHLRSAENSKNTWAPVDHFFVWPELKLGASGTKVSELQAYLMGHALRVDMDGVFGPGTRSAVLAFQTSKKLKVDGIVGPQTSTALRTR